MSQNLFVWVETKAGGVWVHTDSNGTPLRTKDYQTFGKVSLVCKLQVPGDVAPDWVPTKAKGEELKFVYERKVTLTVRRTLTAPLPKGDEDAYFELDEYSLGSPPVWGQVVLVSASGAGFSYHCNYCREWATEQSQIEHYCPKCFSKDWVLQPKA